MPFQHPRSLLGYAPSPQPQTVYSGPDVPTAYDPNWQYLKNLIADQIAWYMRQPEWQNFQTYASLFPKIATPGVPVAVVNAALQAVGKPIATKSLPSPLQSLGSL